MPKRKASSLSCAPIFERSRRSKRPKCSSERRHSPTAKSLQHNLLSPPDSDVALNTRKSKRKREVQQEEISEDTQAHEPAVKRWRSNDTSDPVDVHKSTLEQDDLTAYWVRNDFKWSGVLAQIATMSDKRSQKRSLSRSNSYTQSTRSGDTPKAWGAKHAAIMLENGIFLEKQEGASITQDDEQLCTKILGSSFELPKEWTFHGDNFLTILKMALYKNEARVVRDVGPHVMPSPEMHKAQGHPGLEHIAEGVDAQWTKCTSLCGPKSKPDVSQGVSRTAFTHEEREKLTSNETCACETMMFPFYICEAKCFDRSIEESELQALHGASVACSTVIKLYQKVSAAAKLHRRILAFSVSHNQRVVKIFGHFAMIECDNITYHRHPLFETDLVDDATNRNTPYQIALSIWKHFFPVHLARIRDALRRQPIRAVESFTAQLDLEEDSASGASTPSSSKEDDPSMTRLQEENARLLAVMLKQQEEARRQVVVFERQTERQTELLLAQIQRQSEQYREQMEQQKEEARQRLEQQKEEARQRLEQQKEEARKEREEIIALLKQSRP